MMPAVQTPRLSPDLILMVFEHTDDLSTLNGLSDAYPTLLRPMLERRFDTLVFGASWPEELRQYVYTILLAEIRTPTTVQELQVLMADQLEGSGPRKFPPALPRTRRTLKRLGSLTDTINFFVHLCAAMYLPHFPLEKQAPFSPGEELRIRRALLRFQLYTQLFHQPEATDEIVSDRDWEQRHLMEQHFWTRFDSVEAEECKCIYSLLYYSLIHLSPILPSTSEASTSHSPPVKSKRRGLPLLRLVFSGAALSPLASSYAQRFVEYAFTGLEKVDPHCGNYFLPFHDFQAHKDRWERSKRYQPSEARRETNFGVRRRPMPKKYHPVLREPDRMALRLIGYCFWDEERTDWWPEAFGISPSNMVSVEYI